MKKAKNTRLHKSGSPVLFSLYIFDERKLGYAHNESQSGFIFGLVAEKFYS